MCWQDQSHLAVLSGAGADHGPSRFCDIWTELYNFDSNRHPTVRVGGRFHKRERPGACRAEPLHRRKLMLRHLCQNASRGAHRESFQT